MKLFLALGAAALFSLSSLSTPIFAQAGRENPHYNSPDRSGAYGSRRYNRHHYRHHGRRHTGGISRGQNAAKTKTDVNSN